MGENDDEAFLMDDGGARALEDAAEPFTRDPLEPHRGALILVLGILGLVFCAFCAPFAWFLGNEDLAKMRAGTMDPEGEGLTQAGRIMGIIGTVLILIGVAVLVLFLLGAVLTAGSSSGMIGG